jgi:hypothetical protein
MVNIGKKIAMGGSITVREQRGRVVGTDNRQPEDGGESQRHDGQSTDA